MGKRWPSRTTLLQQWLAATVLAILPLVIAVSYAVVALEKQTRNQRQLMEEMDTLAGNASAVSEGIKDLVRIARQYLLLRDREFLDLYQQRAETVSSGVTRLRRQLSPVEGAALFDEIDAMVSEVGERLPDSVTNDDPPRQVNARLTALLNAGNERLGNTVNRYRLTRFRQSEQVFSEIVDQLFLFAMLALPGTLLLMVIGTYRVSRPIWRLSQAIRRLGQQQWDVPIGIDGPSDLAALGDNLDWMRLQVVAGESQKKAFIQHVTHELKTPLAAIIEAGNLLHDGVAGQLGAEQQAVLSILRDNARNLQAMIEQLLNYNAVSHGLEVHVEPVNLERLCDQVRQGLIQTGAGKRVDWHFAGEPAMIAADPRLLDMILRNLMGNAFQYIEDGGRIAVTWGPVDDGWRLAVADNGPGIDPDELPHIFMPFYRGRNSRRDFAPKNGIGLAIVSECVALMQGSISVDSRVGEGATFELLFPRVEQRNVIQ